MLNSIWNFLYKYFPNNHIIRTNYFKMNGNVFYIVDDETGKKTYFPKIKGLCVKFEGENSTLVIHSNPLPTFTKCTIFINQDNNHFEINSSNSNIRNVYIYSSSQNAQIYIGKNLYWGGGKIVLGKDANSKVTIGDNCIFSTEISFKASDSHTIYDWDTKEPINEPKDIFIEDNVWLCEGVKILKGAYLSNWTVVAAGSIVTKEFKQHNIILAGIPAKIIKENIGFDRLTYDKYYEKQSGKLTIDYRKILKKNKFNVRLKKLIKKFKNKKIIIYGAGNFFQYIKKNYDLCELNIIGISDIKFTEEQVGEKFLDYKIITKDQIIEYNPDIVLITTKHYTDILEDFTSNIFANTKIKVYPLFKISIWEKIKKIWS